VNIPFGKIETAADLGRILRQKRKQLGFKQATVAGLCGVGVRFLSELERGKPTAELGKALHVLRRLGLELSVAPRAGMDREHD